VQHDVLNFYHLVSQYNGATPQDGTKVGFMVWISTVQCSAVLDYLEKIDPEVRLFSPLAFE